MKYFTFIPAHSNMKSLYMIAFLITTSMIALGQKMYVAPAPPPKGDTLYFIVQHTIKLEGKLANAIAAESVEALVSVKGDELTITPRTLGEFEVTFIYKDSAVKRKFYSIYLPRPEKPKQSLKKDSLFLR